MLTPETFWNSDVFDLVTYEYTQVSVRWDLYLNKVISFSWYVHRMVEILHRFF